MRSNKQKKKMEPTLLFAGIIVILIGFFIVFISLLSGNSNTETKVVFGGIIGFIPFGFANNRNLLWVVMGISLFIIVLFYLLRHWK